MKFKYLTPEIICEATVRLALTACHASQTFFFKEYTCHAVQAASNATTRGTTSPVVAEWLCWLREHGLLLTSSAVGLLDWEAVYRFTSGDSVACQLCEDHDFKTSQAARLRLFEMCLEEMKSQEVDDEV